MKTSKFTSIFLSALMAFLLSSVSLAQGDMTEEPSAPRVYQVNINTADAEQLASSLSGVGVSRAAAIVAYRQEHGAFESVEELQMVSGVGEKTLEENRNLLTVGNKQ